MKFRQSHARLQPLDSVGHAYSTQRGAYLSQSASIANGTFTLAEARSLCDTLADCMGITHHGAEPKPDERIKLFLKASDEFWENADHTTYLKQRPKCPLQLKRYRRASHGPLCCDSGGCLPSSEYAALERRCDLPAASPLDAGVHAAQASRCATWCRCTRRRDVSSYPHEENRGAAIVRDGVLNLSYFHTQCDGAAQWWRLDFTEPVGLWQIALHNRPDHRYRLVGATITAWPVGGKGAPLANATVATSRAAYVWTLSPPLARVGSLEVLLPEKPRARASPLPRARGLRRAAAADRRRRDVVRVTVPSATTAARTDSIALAKAKGTDPAAQAAAANRRCSSTPTRRPPTRSGCRQEGAATAAAEKTAAEGGRGGAAGTRCGGRRRAAAEVRGRGGAAGGGGGAGWRGRRAGGRRRRRRRADGRPRVRRDARQRRGRGGRRREGGGAPAERRRRAARTRRRAAPPSARRPAARRRRRRRRRRGRGSRRRAGSAPPATPASPPPLLRAVFSGGLSVPALAAQGAWLVQRPGGSDSCVFCDLRLDLDCRTPTTSVGTRPQTPVRCGTAPSAPRRVARDAAAVAERRALELLHERLHGFSRVRRECADCAVGVAAGGGPPIALHSPCRSTVTPCGAGFFQSK